MDKKNILSQWKCEREQISKLTFSKRGDVHQLLSRYSNNGWTLNEYEKNAVSKYICFLEKKLDTLINISNYS